MKRLKKEPNEIELLTLTYQGTLKPSAETKQQLEFISKGCAFVYNWALGKRIEADKREKRQPSPEKQAGELVRLKENNPWLKKICAWTLQEVVRTRVSDAWKKYKDRKELFSKASYPREKTDKGWYDSFSVYQDGYRIKDNRLTLSRGKWENKYQSKIIIPFELTNPLKGIPKTINISFKNNSWKLNIVCDVELPKRISKSEIKSMLGIDRGVRKLFATNQGWKHYNPKYWNKIRKKYIELQQILSRKVRGSNNWKKVLDELRRLCRRVKNRMRDQNHKISRKLVNKNDLTVLEKLETSKMVSKENKKVGKWTRDGIMKACWTQLAGFIIYKAKGAGKWVEFVSPINTSKRCSDCGEVNKELGDKEIFICPSCGYKEDRDVNASQNILEKGIKKLKLQRLGTSLTESV